MEPDFWHDRWLSGRIGFHQAAVDTSLKHHWKSIAAAATCRVFVPLCGKSLDLLWLREQGHQVVGVELSDLALQSFLAENGVAARRRRLAEFDRYEATQLELYGGDFFSLTRQALGNPAAVYDRAALVSWTPALRQRYVAHMTALTQPGTVTLLISFEYAQHQMPGPPFSIDADQVALLYGPSHRIEELARRDVTADEPRLRERGVTRLSEVCYRLTRL